MKQIRKFLCALLSVLLAVPMPSARAAFDPVNDDTDIFLANPNITALRPNVLIILDNTANWNTPFVNEKNALVQVVNGLNDSFNVGLMMMVETGAPNDNVDGGYVRYHIRQMTPTNKTALSSMVNNLDILNDKGNNNTLGLALHEAFLYYGGKASIASFGKVKTDHDGTTDPLLQPLAGLHALPASPNASSLYRSPIADGCAKNFIIYISNGAVNENADARAFIEGKLTTLIGTTPTIIPLSPNGQQDNWGDEMARYMANNDVNNTFVNNQLVFTYTVEVNPGTTGQGPSTTALFQSTATQGKGKYFGVTDSASGVAIVDALTAIFNEIQAVNSVFASVTLPVSVNERGTNLNQVYLGVFRPDAVKKPRWFGNLKMYNLALDSATSTPFLADASRGIPPQVGLPAVDAATSFIGVNAQSFWTQASTFWGFRDPSVNGPGGASDLPDGNLVEKGGAAQQQRISFATDQTTRNLYTCTTGLVGGINQICAAGASLSATPFSEANAAIDASTLALGTRQVSPLTAFQTQSVTSLTDRKSATLSNAASPVSVTSLSNGATTLNVTSLTTATPKTVTSLSASVSGSQTRTINSIIKSGSIFVVTAAGALPSAYVNGATVTFTGFANGSWNNLSLAISSVNTAANTFQVNPPGNPGNAATGDSSVPSTVDSTTAVATVAGHGYADSQLVTIAGATPSQFNGTYGISLGDSTGADPTNKFRYTISPAAGTATGTITAAGNTTVASVTYSPASGAPLAAGSTVTIHGASDASYNGTKTVLASPAPTTTSFSYSVAPSTPSPNVASPVYAVIGGSTTVTVTAPLHGFVSSPPQVTIANSDIGGYNGTFDITVLDANTFTYTTASVLPANSSAIVTASTGFSPTVTATVTNHGFGNPGNSVTVIIEGGTQPLHTSGPAGFTATIVDLNTFTYTNNQAVAPAGSYTARLSPTRATATIPNHGYGVAPATIQVLIAGATPAPYNGTFTATIVDANTITYPLTWGAVTPAANTSASVTSSVQSTTARATSVAHAFTTGDSVAISGATPAAFNGTFTVTVTDVNNFTYTLASAQGDATGTILATGAGVSSAARDSLIRWVRGQDNFEDENLNGSTSDVRAMIHGDVLHSRPAVINYNRYGSDNDVYVFYGANDGVFRAIKGGYATDASAVVNIQPGQEAWGFIPTEFFGQLNRLRTNSPIVSSSFKKPYFADGPIGNFIKDGNGNGILGEVGDTANLYLGMRRGGRFLYALDVNNPHDPKFLWKIDNTTAGFSELGQTWSRPRVVTDLAGLTTPVVLFGAGYDPNVEDLEPSAITASDATSVTTLAGTTNRSMGRGIYVVDATTGALLWSAGRPGSGATLEVPGMDYAIPADLAVIVNESGGPPNRAYVGDTGGNVWRIDFRNPLSGSMVTQIASLGGAGAVKRKFLSQLDVVKQAGFDAILIGSGDREHPFDTSVTNRFYMIKDFGTDAGPATGGSTTVPTAVGTDTPVTDTGTEMFDATDNCLQDEAVCAAGSVARNSAIDELATSRGWFITLLPGEKTVGSAISAGGTVFFGTNQPDAGAGGGTCNANLGIARAYAVSVADATVPNDPNSPGPYTAADRHDVLLGGGNPPPPVLIFTTPTGSTTGDPVPVICFGPTCLPPPGVALASRLRKYWYKEIDK